MAGCSGRSLLAFARQHNAASQCARSSFLDSQPTARWMFVSLRARGCPCCTAGEPAVTATLAVKVIGLTPSPSPEGHTGVHEDEER